MTAADPTIEERVAELEAAQKKLGSSVETLKRGQRETRAQVRNLEKLVEGIPAAIKTQLDQQTNDLRTDLSAAETRNADRITGVARQWPAGAIILATLAGTGLLGMITDLLLAATGHPHVR